MYYFSTLVKYAEASQPSSPSKQLLTMKSQKKEREMSPEELELYSSYLTSDKSNIVLRGMPRAQILRIKSKLNQKWLTNIMLKRKVAQISDEIIDNHLLAEKKSVIDYVLLDPAEKMRTGIYKLPHEYKTCIINRLNVKLEFLKKEAILAALTILYF